MDQVNLVVVQPVIRIILTVFPYKKEYEIPLKKALLLRDSLNPFGFFFVKVGRYASSPIKKWQKILCQKQG